MRLRTVPDWKEDDESILGLIVDWCPWEKGERDTHNVFVFFSRERKLKICFLCFFFFFLRGGRAEIKNNNNWFRFWSCYLFWRKNVFIVKKKKSLLVLCILEPMAWAHLAINRTVSVRRVPRSGVRCFQFQGLKK